MKETSRLLRLKLGVAVAAGHYEPNSLASRNCELRHLMRTNIQMSGAARSLDAAAICVPGRWAEQETSFTAKPDEWTAPRSTSADAAHPLDSETLELPWQIYRSWSDELKIRQTAFERERARRAHLSRLNRLQILQLLEPAKTVTDHEGTGVLAHKSHLSAVSKMFGRAARFCRSWLEKRRIRKAVRDLEQLNDQTLKDIGLQHGAIESQVRAVSRKSR
jgi:uncharacterized protein YjiS (DUF1127 family)